MMACGYNEFLYLVFRKHSSYLMLLRDNNLFWHSISSKIGSINRLGGLLSLSPLPASKDTAGNKNCEVELQNKKLLTGELRRYA